MSSCALCKEMPCCPEHCCNWDDCECGDCDACMVKVKLEPQQPKTLIHEPVKIILLGQQPLERDKEQKLAEEIKLNNSLEETKDSIKDSASPKAAGGGVFGIRYLKKKK